MNSVMMARETAILGGGCFWCVEAVYSELEGVDKVLPGYMGGTTANPTYKDVCTGTTGHAEVAWIEFDPEIISYTELLEVFFFTHDPTTLNRQGNDIGTQYRSVIFHTSDTQRDAAIKAIQVLDESNAYPSSIVTEVSQVQEFYPAEDYHHDYFRKNPDNGYCQVMIRPKLEKFRSVFKSLLKHD